jgi:hypothetical protein
MTTLNKVFNKRVSSLTGSEIRRIPLKPTGANKYISVTESYYDVRFLLPNIDGILLSAKSGLDNKIKVSGTTTGAPLRFCPYNDFIEVINGVDYQNTGNAFNQYMTMMCNLHYDDKVLQSSVGYKLGATLDQLPVNTEGYFRMPLSNPKLQNFNTSIIQNNPNLSHFKTYELVYRVSTNIKDMTSGDATDLTIFPELELYVLMNPQLKEKLGKREVTLSTTRFHYQRCPVKSSEESFSETLKLKHFNLKGLIVSVRYDTVINSTTTEKYENNYVPAIKQLNIDIDGDPFFSHDIQFNKQNITEIDFMEKLTGLDTDKTIGAYMDFTSAESTKVFYCIPLSIFNNVINGIDTKTNNKSIELRCNKCSFEENAQVEIFSLYDEMYTHNQATQSFAKKTFKK